MPGTLRKQAGHAPAALLCGLCWALISLPAQADLVSVSGNGNIISSASGGTLANFFNDSGPNPKVHGWDEAQNVVLSKDVFVDINTSGVFDRNADLAGFNDAKISQGTRVDSHLLYFDPKGSGAVENVKFTFSGTILGVIVESDRFYNTKHSNTDYFLSSDFLKSTLTPAANYATTHFDNRGLELGSATDSIVVSISGKTVTISDYHASNPGDQIRVLTAAVPEPSTFVIFGVSAALLGMGHMRRRRRDA